MTIYYGQSEFRVRRKTDIPRISFQWHTVDTVILKYIRLLELSDERDNIRSYLICCSLQPTIF